VAQWGGLKKGNLRASTPFTSIPKTLKGAHPSETKNFGKTLQVLESPPDISIAQVILKKINNDF